MNWQYIIGIILIAVTAWSLYDLWVKNQVRSIIGKICWSALLILTGPFGLILYYFVGRKQWLYVVE